jgi:hypothetical protein
MAPHIGPPQTTCQGGVAPAKMIHPDSIDHEDLDVTS